MTAFPSTPEPSEPMKTTILNRLSGVHVAKERGDVTSGFESPNLLERSMLYREFLAEREQILRHKWLESEKAGRDIGFEHALASWVVHHRSQWRKERQQKALQHV
jgi:hypothetical protein